MNLHLKIYWPWRSNTKGYWVDIKCDNIIQSMKHSSFHFFRAFTVFSFYSLLHFVITHHSESSVLTVRSLALSAPFLLTVQKALTVRLQCFHNAFTVRSGFTYRSVCFHSVLFRTQKWKDQSLRAKKNEKRRHGRKLIFHIKILILIRI